MADSIKITLELADKAAQQSLSDFVNKASNADKAFKKMGDSGSQAFSGINVGIGQSIDAFDVFGANLAANLVTQALTGIAELAHKAFEVFIVEGVKASEEAEAALNSLNVAMAQAGRYSEKSSQSFQDFADEIQRTTTYEDDAIIKNAALLESMTRLDEKGLQRATKAAINLASAFNIDLETATRNLAKAAEGNVTSLNKLGLQFEVGGTKGQTFENALVAIESRLGTSATSKVNTYQGAIAQATNSFGDLQKEIGNVITQNPVFVAAIQAVKNAFDGASESVKNNQSFLQKLTGGIAVDTFSIFTVGVNAAREALDLFTKIGREASKVLVSIAEGAAFLVTLPLGLFSDDFKKITQGLSADSNKLALSVGSNLSDPTLFSEPSKALEDMGNKGKEAFDKIGSGAKANNESLKNNANVIADLTERQKKLNEENNKFAETLALQSEAGKAAYEQRLSDAQAFYDSQAALDEEVRDADYEAKAQQSETELIQVQELYLSKQDAIDAQYDAEKARLDQSTVDNATYYAALETLQTQHDAKTAKLDADRASKVKKIDTEITKNKEQESKKQLADAGNLFGGLAALAATGGKEMFEVSKALNLAQAITYGILSIQEAAASAPFPANIATVAAATAFAAANVIRISQTQAPSFQDGGIVPGSSFFGDKVSANVNSGEMILNRTQQSKLFELANGQGNGGVESNGGGLANTLASALEKMSSQPIVVNVDGRELFNILRSGLNSGRSLA
jgi:hypothetical protein